MTLTKTGKKKLFRMTIKRKIMLSDIISSLNIRLESKDEDGFARMLVLHNDNLTEEERSEKLKKLDTELQELYLIHDVLESVAIHEQDWLLDMHMKVNRGWQNEWDVPLDIFNESIEKMIDLLKWYKESPVVVTNKERYDKKIDFLLLLKEFRNQENE